MLKQEEEAIHHLELADFYISNYVGRMNQSDINETVEESSTDEARIDKRLSSAESSQVLSNMLPEMITN